MNLANPSSAFCALDQLKGSESELEINSDILSIQQCLDSAEKSWNDASFSHFPAFSGITSSATLGLLIYALCAGKNALFMSPGTPCPAQCGALISDQGLPMQVDDASPNVFEQGEEHQPPRGLVFLSSGTLGPAKKIWHSNQRMAMSAQVVANRLSIDADDRVLITVPLHHMYGLGAALLPAIMKGARIKVLVNANLLSINDAMKNFKPTLVYSTPHLLRTYLRRRSQALEGCRAVVLAGDVTTENMAEQASQIFGSVYNLYGSSELGVVAISSVNRPQELVALQGVTVDVLASEQQKNILTVDHPYRAELIDQGTGPQPLTTPWNTSDIATVNQDNSFTIHGRADLSVNRAGKLLVLAELEQQIAEWPGIDMAIAVVHQTDGSFGKKISVLITAREDTLNQAELRALAIQNLPAFARPEYFKLVKQLPCLKSGKPDRIKITEEYLYESV
ncbi:MAG: acyl-coenzyme A synthetase/AMP-(fatty) acid ligase [Arenicella sp.]|jgi:acyl-coenzyme A synthetase/AMP-(fatty) acid ligase